MNGIELYTIVAEWLEVGFVLLGGLCGMLWAYLIASV